MRPAERQRAPTTKNSLLILRRGRKSGQGICASSWWFVSGRFRNCPSSFSSRAVVHLLACATRRIAIRKLNLLYGTYWCRSILEAHWCGFESATQTDQNLEWRKTSQNHLLPSAGPYQLSHKGDYSSPRSRLHLPRAAVALSSAALCRDSSL